MPLHWNKSCINFPRRFSRGVPPPYLQSNNRAKQIFCPSGENRLLQLYPNHTFNLTSRSIDKVERSGRKKKGRRRIRNGKYVQSTVKERSFPSVEKKERRIWKKNFT